jgi:hypothetical protein
MHDTKPWYASLTIWGAVVSVIASALALFKVHLDPQLQADLRDWLLAAATLAGGAASLWGRLRASRRIETPGTVVTTAGAAASATPAARKPRPQHWRLNALLPFAPILLLLPLSQCTGCAALSAALTTVPPPPDYIAADRATYEAVAPEYAAYVAADAALDDQERATRRRTLEAWNFRLETAGQGTKAQRHEGTKGLPGN